MKKITQNLMVALTILSSMAIISQTEVEDSTLQELEEVVLMGSGVIDLAADRVTPVAASTIKGSEIQKKIGTQDITMTLVNTPSVYVAGQAGGYGDSRIAVRGFEQDNTAYMLNGQPINGMEDGKMYWSNWSGMNDVASVVEIQRGLGASKLAISSVGGTVNFVMNSNDVRQGGFMYAGIANDDYLKTTYSYNTGRSDDGWATSFLLTHWQGDGYNEGSYGQGQTYFFSVGKEINEKHSLNFLMTGAPQWHDQNFSKSISKYLEYGRKYNNNWGMYGDQYLTERRNFYHKPVMNLNWDYKISDDSSLSTVFYVSTGNGGGTGGRGSRPRTEDGYVDYNAIYAQNQQVPGGAGVNYGDYDNYITRASMNMHNWVGLVSNYEKQLSDNLSLTVGVDFRTYYGEHFRIVENFHGLTSWRENMWLRDSNHQQFGLSGQYKDVVTSRDMSANPWTAVMASFNQDEKIAYSNDERITYGGLFSQLEYSNDKMSAFFQGAISQQSHQRFDHYQYADQSLIDGTSSQSTETLPVGTVDGVDSEKVNNMGYNVKAGAGFNVGDNSKVFFNTGMYSRQPYHDNIYLNFTNRVNPLTENEKIFGLEAGYSYSTPNFSANVNAYRTSWKDRVVTSSYVDDDVVFFNTNEGVEQLHQGIEIDFRAKPQPDLPYTLTGFLSIGDWQYVGDAVTRTTDENQNVIGTETNDVDGGKVGDAAQFTAGLGIDMKLAENVSFDTDIRFYDELYSDVGAIKENMLLPSFHLWDAGLSYKMYLGADDEKSLNIRINVNNVSDAVYLSELRTTTSTLDEDDVTGVEYRGIDTGNQGYFGLGRTWNVGLRYKF
jgi:hypothetical protein